MAYSDPDPENALTTVCQLASGGMGKVEVAVRREGRFERLYAVKRLHAAQRKDPQLRSMFMDEARIAGLIRHANVVPVLDVGEDHRGPFLVMDYIDGLPLSEVISHHRQRDELLPVQLCLRIGAHVASGLHAAHELRDARGKPLQIVHRDLSPANVLLGYDGVARVTDFGVAKALDRATQTATGVLKGKFGYMSPEQLRFETLDRRSDLFSLGVVLFELLSCRRLYGGKGDNQEAARRILNEPPPDLDDVRKDVPPEITALLFELLAKDRELRPRTARVIARRLEEVLIDLRADEGPIGLPEYLESVFSDERAARRRKVETGLRILDKRAGRATETDVTTLEPLRPSKRPISVSDSKPSPPARSSTPARAPLPSVTPSGSYGLGEMVFEAPGNLLYRHGNLLVQIRSGPMKDEVLDAFEVIIARLVKRYDKAAYLGVIEQTAELPPTDIRRRQKQLIEDQLDKIDVRLAVVIKGHGVVAQLSRSVARMLVPGHQDIRILANVGEALRFLEPHFDDATRAGARDAVERAQARNRELDRV